MFTRSFLLVLATTCFLMATATTESGNIQLFHEVSAKCKEEHGLKQEELVLLNETKPLETDDENLKCYLKCLLTGLKLMNEEGEITLNGTEDRNPKYRKHLSTCKDVTGEDSCDKALNFQNCIWKQIEMEEKGLQ